MDKTLELLTAAKKTMLWASKVLYFTFASLFLLLLAFNLVNHGTYLSGRMDFIFLYACFLYAIPFWLMHVWIKNTKYVGLAGSLIALCLLWAYTPFFKTLRQLIQGILF